MILELAGNEDLPPYLKYGALEVQILDTVKEFYDQGIEYVSLELLHSKIKINKVITARHARELIGYGLKWHPKKGYSYVPDPQHVKRSAIPDTKTDLLLSYLLKEFNIKASRAWIRQYDLCYVITKNPADLVIGDVINMNSMKDKCTWFESLEIDFLDYHPCKKGAAYRVSTARKKTPYRYFAIINESAQVKMTFDIRNLDLPAGLI